MKTKTLILSCIAVILSAFSSVLFAQTDGDKIAGMWIPGSGKAIVKIENQDGKYFGKIIWLKNPNNDEGKPKTDKNNPNEKEKTKPLLGLSLLKNFSYAGDNVWNNGTIYDPENGKTYSCKITMVDENTLDVRGFMGITLIGRTDQWKKAAKKE